jgi:hypothetical protein
MTRNSAIVKALVRIGEQRSFMVESSSFKPESALPMPSPFAAQIGVGRLSERVIRTHRRAIFTPSPYCAGCRRQL